MVFQMIFQEFTRLPSGYVQWSLPFIKGGDNWTHIIEPKTKLTIQRRLKSSSFVNIDSRVLYFPMLCCCLITVYLDMICGLMEIM